MSITENIINALREQNKNEFTLSEVISIVESVTKMTNLPTLESEGFLFLPTRYEVFFDNKSIKLPKKVFNLLYYFVANKNKVINRDNILRDIWGADVWVEDRTIDVHIRKVREIVGKNNLKTIKGIGYGWFEK